MEDFEANGEAADAETPSTPGVVLNNVVLGNVGLEIADLEPASFFAAPTVQGASTEPAQNAPQPQTEPQSAVRTQPKPEPQRDRKTVQSTLAPGTPWYSFVTPALGKLMRLASRLFRYAEGGFAGQVIGRFDQGFLTRTLAELPYGVVLVAGAHDTATTRRMIVSMFENLGVRVFTSTVSEDTANDGFGADLMSALLGKVNLKGGLAADIAVLELNGISSNTAGMGEAGTGETSTVVSGADGDSCDAVDTSEHYENNDAADKTYLTHFLEQTAPRYALLLNASREQLRRADEISEGVGNDGNEGIDGVVQLLGRVAQTTGGTVVLNREDARIAHLAAQVPQDTKTTYFGLVNSLRVSDAGSLRLNLSREAFESTAQPADVVLKNVDEGRAEFLLDGRAVRAQLQHGDVHELFDAAAALAVVRAVAADQSLDVYDERLMQALA
ncbi:hypothetical protein [Bifidobacterium sp.]|jgi:hypothetical protein|uniref:hypothetical protein n=1 Tax=Bifidobacterium sp. TaxID=41200 RepID=UPI0025BCC2A4|nr:hypothetical protein [Bifidobacterium sp.]MCI1224716.1 hypothetical protein [Bifidobacterium sp.]